MAQHTEPRRLSAPQLQYKAHTKPVNAATGCGARTMYLPHYRPVRLRETVKDVKVWVKDADGEPVAGRMDLPEGWYALPLEEDE